LYAKSNFTLKLGLKDSGTDGTYAKNGCQLVVNASPLFTATTASRGNALLEGTFYCYSSILSGFGTVDLGNSGSNTIELIQTDFYDNSTINFGSSGLTIYDCKCHFPGTAKSNIGHIYNFNFIDKLAVYQVVDGFEVRVSKDISGYIASDTSYDIVILDTLTVGLIDSQISSSKIKLVTS
jgi:hypothetical protein